MIEIAFFFSKCQRIICLFSKKLPPLLRKCDINHKKHMKIRTNLRRWTIMGSLLVLPTFASAQNDAYVYPDGTYKVLTRTNWNSIYFTDGGVRVDNSEVQPYESYSEVYFNKISTALPLIRMDNNWNGENMVEAEGSVEGNRHYHYKGFLPTNRTDGTFVNFYSNNKEFWLCPVGSRSIYLQENTRYPVVRKSAEQGGFILPFASNASLPATDKPAAMLDIDLWISDANGAEMQISRIENPKLFISGGTSPWKLEHETVNPVYLAETERGSMIFQGKYTTTGVTSLTFFAPRYKYDWTSQRITTYDENGGAVNIDATDKWIVGMKPWGTTQGGWNLPAPNTPYVVTVDLRHSDRTQNRIMVQPLTQTVNVSAALWATYAPSFKVSTTTTNSTGANTQLRYVTWQENGTDIERPSIAAGQTLQRGEGILIKADKPTVVTFTYDPEGTPVTLEGNRMRGVIDDPIDRPTDCTPYLLANKSHGLAFYLWDPEATSKLAVNKSYLAMPKDQGLPTLYDLEDEETAILAMPEDKLQNAEIYNLSGQRVQHTKRGVNIVNGKKVLY